MQTYVSSTMFHSVETPGVLASLLEFQGNARKENRRVWMCFKKAWTSRSSRITETDLKLFFSSVMWTVDEMCKTPNHSGEGLEKKICLFHREMTVRKKIYFH